MNLLTIFKHIFRDHLLANLRLIRSIYGLKNVPEDEEVTTSVAAQAPSLGGLDPLGRGFPQCGPL
jgi:hypothetical protein